MGFKTGKRDFPAHTHTHTEAYSCLLPETQKHTFAPSPQTQTHFKKFFSSIPPLFFIFGNDIASPSPPLKKPYHPLHVPFSHFLPLSKSPSATKIVQPSLQRFFLQCALFFTVKRVDLNPYHSMTGSWDELTLRGTTAGELWACRSTWLPHNCADASQVCSLFSVMSAASAAIFPLETGCQKRIC